MSAEFDITVTPQAMRNYRFYHKYTKLSGIIELLLGAFLVVLCIITAGKTQISYTLIVGFAGILFLVIMPAGMAFRAGKTVKNSPRFQVPTHYLISDEKMVVSMEQQKKDAGNETETISAEVKWDEIYSVKETKMSILIYFTPFNANILPKDQLGDRLDTVKQILKEHVNPYMMKLK